MGAEELVKHGLKITPQRIAVLEAMKTIDGHPTADNVIEFIRKNHPHIAIGTVYKTLDVFVEKGLLKKVKTEKDIMRYEIAKDIHHHLYCHDSERIEDYFDQELDDLLTDFFAKRKIPNFTVEDIKLQITGKFSNSK
ncbi:Fur family transcriptional regulator [Perlabentimonas gracilis]|uniref:Fur family transcriptional regulator n=1 Tax=Perlabentimonas gracilis TaxID=2715279 RepID=UPI001409D431|nr:transcriptional repressor [Perlabentimonas gracilis]NHB67428.1 transcriptional repressor [Perlabentimonas gracilis]